MSHACCEVRLPLEHCLLLPPPAFTLPDSDFEHWRLAMLLSFTARALR